MQQLLAVALDVPGVDRMLDCQHLRLCVMRSQKSTQGTRQSAAATASSCSTHCICSVLQPGVACSCTGTLLIFALLVASSHPRWCGGYLASAKLHAVRPCQSLVPWLNQPTAVWTVHRVLLPDYCLLPCRLGSQPRMQQPRLQLPPLLWLMTQMLHHQLRSRKPTRSSSSSQGGGLPQAS